MEMMTLNGKSEKLNTGRFIVKTGINDPRGRHCVVYDTKESQTVSQVWGENDAIELMMLANDGKIQLSRWAAPINEDVDKYLS
jgi:hypothetical protein